MAKLSRIRAALEAFDGTHVAPLEELSDDLEPDTPVLKELLRLAARDAELEVGATWLLKRYAENGADLPAARSFASLLPKLTTDAARLHVLQTLPHLRLTPAVQDRLHETLVILSTAEHKFVRAWAFHGFALLAKAHPRWRDDALSRLEEAHGCEAASVRARIRNSMQELEA